MPLRFLSCSPDGCFYTNRHSFVIFCLPSKIINVFCFQIGTSGLLTQDKIDIDNGIEETNTFIIQFKIIVKLGSRSKFYLKSLIRDLDLELVAIIAMYPPTHKTFLSRIILKSLHV